MTALEYLRDHIEWSGHPGHPGQAACPDCANKKDDGHRPGCALAAALGDDGWLSMDTAPLDGTVIQARIPGYGEDNLIAWIADALEDGHGSCGAWAFMSDQEPPSCWTDGWCWAENEDGVRSAWPTYWLPAPPAKPPQPSGGEG